MELPELELPIELLEIGCGSEVLSDDELLPPYLELPELCVEETAIEVSVVHGVVVEVVEVVCVGEVVEELGDSWG